MAEDNTLINEVSKLQDNINDYLNEIILENPSRSADLAVDPLTLTLSDDGKFIDITELVIDENYRNQGLGREVFNRIKEFANNNNLSITTTPFVGELEDLVKKEGFVKEGNQYILQPDTPTNVVDNKLSTFDTTLNSADGNVEFYIKHQGTQVSANDIRYNPNLGSDTEKFIPGFYGEPVGDVSAKTMGIKIQDNPVSNYYKVQVNTNNLLITQPDGFLGNQIDKVDWNIFAKETGISLSDIKNPKTQNVNSLINELKQLGLDDGTIAEGFRKSGIEGFVELKGDWREVVLIDPNDDLGIGSKLNIEDATEVEFLNNQSKVNQIDELVIKPTNVVDERKFYNPSDDLDEFGLPLTDEAREEIRSLDNQLIDDSALNDLTMPESPQELLETGKPGNVVLTEDGYKFLILPDGQLTDGDMVYGSLRELRDEVSADIIDTLNSEEYKIKLKEYKDIGIEFNDQPGGSLGAAKLNDPLVFDSWIDNYAKTTTSFIDNLPLSTTVKNQFNNLVKGRARNLATPGGVADAVDVWELGVLGLMIAAVAYKEYDEIPTILTNKAIDMFNNMTSFYNIPPVPKEEYNLDYEFINKVVETGEKFMPTDIIIKKVGEVVKGAAETGTVTGFGYVPTTPEKTDTMEKTQRIQPGVQEEKMFEQARPKKNRSGGSGGGSGARIE